MDEFGNCEGGGVCGNCGCCCYWVSEIVTCFIKVKFVGGGYGIRI